MTWTLEKSLGAGVVRFFDALEKGRSEDIAALASAFSPSDRNEVTNTRGFRPLEVAVERSDETMFKALIAAGFDPSVRQVNADPLLMFAHTPQMLEIIVASGCDIDEKVVSRYDSTALHYFCASGSPLMAKKLIELGADVDARNLYNQTPLHVAADYVKLKSVALLLASGADASALDDRGNTPLHLAVKKAADVKARFEHANEVVKCLLDVGGVGLKQKNGDGKSLLQLAGRNDELKEILNSYGRSVLAKRELGGVLDEIQVNAAPRRSSGLSL